MKHSLKSIVKESLREAFYTKKVIFVDKFDEHLLNEEVFHENLNEEFSGQRMYIIVDSMFHRQLGSPLKVQSVVSKNTKYFEDSWRISWFNRDRTEAKGHLDFNEEDYNYIMKNKEFPLEIKERLARIFDCKPQDIKLKFVNKFVENKQSLNETLFFLENSARELELFIDNKRPA